MPSTVAGRERAPVGAERERGDRAVAVEDAERRWAAAHERREQAGAGRGRVVEGDAGAGEPQRLVAPILGQGLGREPPGVGGGGRAARALALRERDHPGDHGGGEQHADPGEQRPQAAVGAPLALRLALARGAALLEEGALELVRLALVLGGPLERRGEPGAAVELGGIAPGALPLARRRGSGAGEGAGPPRPPRASRAAAATPKAAPRGRPRPCPRRRSPAGSRSAPRGRRPRPRRALSRALRAGPAF